MKRVGRVPIWSTRPTTPLAMADHADGRRLGATPPRTEDFKNWHFGDHVISLDFTAGKVT
jgi:hypothetical protein